MVTPMRCALALLALLAAPAMGAVETAPFPDLDSARAVLHELRRAGLQVQLHEHRERRRYTTVSLHFRLLRQARFARQRLRRLGIDDAFVRRHRRGGWLVHAGAFADPRDAQARVRRLERLGYRRILLGHTWRSHPRPRLRIHPPIHPPAAPSDAPRPRRTTSPPTGTDQLHLETHLFQGRGQQTWGSGRRLFARLGAQGQWRGWQARFSLDVDGWSDDQSPHGRLDVRLGPSHLQHQGADGRWRLGLLNPVATAPAPFDRIARLDLTRPPPFEDTRPQPALSWSQRLRDGRLRLFWNPWFRPAYDPDGQWAIVDTRRGRLLGRRVPARLREVLRRVPRPDAPTLHGGLALHWTRHHGHARQRLAIHYDRPSLPYYRLAPALRRALDAGLDLDAALASLDGPALEALHPPGWSLGFQEQSTHWRIAGAFLSAVPYTRPDLSIAYGNRLAWRLQRHLPTPGRTRLQLLLEGSHLTGDPDMLDRRSESRIGTRLHRPLGPRARAMADLRLGLDRAELIFQARLDIQPQDLGRVSLAARVYAGQEDTLGGYYADRSHLSLSWQLRTGP